MVVRHEPIKAGAGALELVDLFELDGDTYRVPGEIPAHLTVDMLDMIADGVPTEQAIAQTVREVLGGNEQGSAWETLRTDRRISGGEFQQIWDVVERMVQAVSEDTVGKRRPVPRR